MKRKNDDIDLDMKIETLTGLVKALQQREDAVVISNEALKLSIESIQIENAAIMREIGSLKKINEALKADIEVLKSRDEALKPSEGAINTRDEAIPSSKEAIHQRAEALTSSEEARNSRGEAIQSNKGALKSRAEAIKISDEALQPGVEVIKQNGEVKKSSEEATSLRNEQLSKSGEFASFVKAKANEVKKLRVRSEAITARLVQVFLEIAGKGSVRVFEMRENMDIPRSTMDHTLLILRKMNWVYLRGGQKFGAYTLTDEGKSVIEKFGVTGVEIPSNMENAGS